MHRAPDGGDFDHRPEGRRADGHGDGAGAAAEVWATPIGRNRRRRLRLAGTIAGAALVLAAVVVVVVHGGELGRALAALAAPSPAALAALAAAILGSTLLTTFVLLVLIRRFGRVGFGEMLRLVCASTLGNFLPLQPGLAGRVAYHHLVNRIPVRLSVLSIAEATLVSAVATALLVLSIWIVHRGIAVPAVLGAGTAAAPPSSPTLAAWWLPALAGLVALPLLPWPKLRPFALALLARWLDLLLWALRAWACFALVGADITPRDALAFACVALAANMVPFIGNGLGVREWAVGLLATPLAGVPVEAGLAAELVGRAAELVFFVPAGLASARGIMRRLRAALPTIDRDRRASE